MTDQKDFFRAAQLLINTHQEEAENFARMRMQKFLDEEDVVGASTWLMIAQCIAQLQNTIPDKTVH